MRKSKKTVSSSQCSFPLELSPPDNNFPFHTSKHLPGSPRNTKFSLWISEKSLRSGLTQYFHSWFYEVKYRTLRILIFLTKSETSASHSHRVVPHIFPQWPAKTFVNSITARRPLDHFSLFSFPDPAFSNGNNIKYHPISSLGVMIFVCGVFLKWRIKA